MDRLVWLLCPWTMMRTIITREESRAEDYQSCSRKAVHIVHCISRVSDHFQRLSPFAHGHYHTLPPVRPLPKTPSDAVVGSHDTAAAFVVRQFKLAIQSPLSSHEHSSTWHPCHGRCEARCSTWHKDLRQPYLICSASCYVVSARSSGKLYSSSPIY